MNENALNFWRDMYEQAKLELEGAMNRFNHANPNNKDAIDSSIYSINSAQSLVAYSLRRLQQTEEESLCLA